MTTLDIKIGYLCNNNCYFCIQGNKREKYKPKELDEIKQILKNEFNKGVRFVNFTGGEPTIHKTLIPSVEFAKKLGFEKIKIQSNGQTFSDLNYCIKIIKAGANIFEPSIHGYYPTTHDNLVKFQGGWKKVVIGIHNLKKLGQIVIINSVITKQNYKEAPKLANLLVKLKIDSFQFAFPHIGGSARKYHKMIVPTKTEIMPYIKNAIDIASKGGINCYTEAIPYCLMKGYEKYIAENYNKDSSIYDAEYKMNSYKEYKINGGKVKHSKCKSCEKNNICEGPWVEYPEIFGWDEFKPIINRVII